MDDGFELWFFFSAIAGLAAWVPGAHDIKAKL